MPRFAVILPAAGKSSRYGDTVKKVFAELEGRPVWLRAVEAFVNRDDVVQTLAAEARREIRDGRLCGRLGAAEEACWCSRSSRSFGAEQGEPRLRLFARPVQGPSRRAG